MREYTTAWSLNQSSIAFQPRVHRSPQISFNTSLASTLPTMAGGYADNRFVRRWHEQCPFFIRIEVTIVFCTLTVAEDGHLAFKALNGTINVGLAPSVAYVIQQVAGSEVVAPVYHYIVVPYQFSGILLVQTEGGILPRLHRCSNPALYGAT